MPGSSLLGIHEVLRREGRLVNHFCHDPQDHDYGPFPVAFDGHVASLARDETVKSLFYVTSSTE